MILKLVGMLIILKYGYGVELQLLMSALNNTIPAKTAASLEYYAKLRGDAACNMLKIFGGLILPYDQEFIRGLVLRTAPIDAGLPKVMMGFYMKDVLNDTQH